MEVMRSPLAVQNPAGEGQKVRTPKATALKETACPPCAATCAGDHGQHLLAHVGLGLDDLRPAEQRVPPVFLGRVDSAGGPAAGRERRFHHWHALPCRRNPRW